MSTKVLRLPDVESITGLSRSTIYKKIKAGTFPKYMKLGSRSTGWLASDVESWVQSCIYGNMSDQSSGGGDE